MLNVIIPAYSSCVCDAREKLLQEVMVETVSKDLFIEYTKHLRYESFLLQMDLISVTEPGKQSILNITFLLISSQELYW